MGLDAVVFCDCVEKGRLTVPHPYPRLLYIASNGSPEIRSRNPAKVDEHDKWMNLPPCEHEGMMFDACNLGNAGSISHLYEVLSGAITGRRRAYPVLLGKVLYSGAHTGDYLAVTDVRRLSAELDQLREAMPSMAALSGEDARRIELAVGELRRLVKSALAVIKPIAF
jgi:hypothetical protein